MKTHKHHYDPILKGCDTCEPKPQHAPTPWEVVDYDGRWLIDSVQKVGSIAITTGGQDKLTKANAEFIVRAVNSHDELVEFAEMVSRSACDSQYLSTTCICFSCKAKRLLAKIGRKQ